MNKSHTTSVLAAALAMAGAAMISGCADSGDPVNAQGSRNRGRAVMNPFSISSTNDEVFSRNSGAMPLLEVDFSSDKNSPPQVHTVMDDVASITGTASTQPATQPATQAASTEAATPNVEGFKVAAQQKPDDKISFTRDNEANVDLWITSASGIGSVTLERTGDNWPPIVRLHLSYNKERPFTRLEGLEASEVAGDRKVALKTSLDKEAGKGQIAIPTFSRAPQIQIQWVDAYR